MMPARRLCVVTPYFKESRELLDRCLASVRRQTVAADHLLVADGFPQDWLDDGAVRHVRLDRPHRDYGNAARGVGALLAIAEGYDGIAFLDADNWFDDDHMAACVAEADRGGSDPAYVVAQRRFRRPNGSTIDGSPHDVPLSKHVDTNCYLFLPGAFAVLHRWCTMPNALAAYGDQIFGKMLRATGLRSALVPRRTVNYLCLSDPVYRLIGEEPPPGCKPLIRWAEAQAWLLAQPPAMRLYLESLTGLTFDELVAPAEDVPTAAVPLPVRKDLRVEIPRSSRAARLRRTDADVAEYQRIFVAQAYATVALPTHARLILDIAAGIGLSALFLIARYPDVVLVAIEPDPDACAVLETNLADRSLCQVLRAEVTASFAGHSQPAGPPQQCCPRIDLSELVLGVGHSPIDLVRMTPIQWRDFAATSPASLAGIRYILIDGPDGARCLDVAASIAANCEVEAAPVPSDPSPSLAAA